MKTARDLVAAAKARIPEVSVADAEAAVREASVLVDVREADEFAAGHVPGAVHISRGMLEFRFSRMAVSGYQPAWPRQWRLPHRPWRH
jgi:hypothetical protein